MPPSGCTVQQSGTGCQKYSSSVSPSSRGRSCTRQWKSSCSASWGAVSLLMNPACHRFRTGSVLRVRQTVDMSETTSRVLQLLGLLQSRRVWSGEELAQRLGVTGRSVRRDIDRLRELGYPVLASKGHGGGYQLGAGAAMPPLLLDPDEAVAMAVCLRGAAGGSVAGVGESALRALSKLDQVMPARLRAQVSVVHEATVTLTSGPPETQVEPDVLMTLARASRDHEHVTAGYVDRAGVAAERRLEPYQLVTTGRRWYVLAYDRDRRDWRSLRLDRMADVRALGTTFVPREASDAAAYVRRAITSSPYRYVPRAPTIPRQWCPGWRCRAVSSRCSSRPRWWRPCGWSPNG